MGAFGESSNAFLRTISDRVASFFFDAHRACTRSFAASMDGCVAGLAFLESLPLAELTDPKLSYLDGIWSGHSTRREATAEFV
jgi:hypothetical protein